MHTPKDEGSGVEWVLESTLGDRVPILEHCAYRWVRLGEAGALGVVPSVDKALQAYIAKKKK